MLDRAALVGAGCPDPMGCVGDAGAQLSRQVIQRLSQRITRCFTRIRANPLTSLGLSVARYEVYNDTPISTHMCARTRACVCAVCIFVYIVSGIYIYKAFQRLGRRSVGYNLRRNVSPRITQRSRNPLILLLSSSSAGARNASEQALTGRLAALAAGERCVLAMVARDQARTSSDPTGWGRVFR
jgi:hypothetical protein